MASTTIIRDKISYRQGVILGFTMAETFLLLVFCLMIGLGALIKRSQDQRDQVLQNNRALVERVEHLQQVLARIRPEGGTDPLLMMNPEYLRKLVEIAGSSELGKLDETWRRIIRSDEAVRRLVSQGVDVTTLSAAEIKAARDYPASSEDRTRAQSFGAIISAIERAGLKMTVQEIADAAIAGARTSGHRWPPIINLSEAGGYNFAVGSAELTPDFSRKIRGSVVDRLIEIARDYDVNVIEVVGHTDEQPIAPRTSNLDQRLPAVLSGASGVDVLRPADNAGLGLSRALSVVSELQRDARLAQLRILPLSGAQLINVDETLARRGVGGDAKERRRIEIRLRKSSN